MSEPAVSTARAPAASAIYDPLTAPDPGRGDAHAPSYWAATAGEAPPDDGPLAQSLDTDVAVIGAGYTGLGCAAFLARDHGARPVVLEANRPLWGCSGRNGSFARPVIGRVALSRWLERFGENGARALFEESFAALDTVRGLIRDGNIDCDVQPDGTLRVAHSEAACRELESDWRLLEQRFGYRTELLTPADLAAAHFRSGDAHGALRSPDGFGMHPLKL
ncbi:MAG: FAD-dependent oxidoreductase, partial [Gammaproteobacteria bacterium]|nr:FAD-dependent oxidoreductase [Gammaproteobacteria bacterium]